MSALRVLGGALVAALLCGCRSGAVVTSEECDRLLEKYTELRLRADGAKVSGTDLERARVEVRGRAKSSLTFRTCTRDVSRESMTCALEAFDADQVERCLIPMP